MNRKKLLDRIIKKNHKESELNKLRKLFQTLGPEKDLWFHVILQAFYDWYFGNTDDKEDARQFLNNETRVLELICKLCLNINHSTIQTFFLKESND